MKKFFHTYVPFLLPYAIFVLIVLVLQITIGKMELHLWLISYRSKFLDQFYIWLTHFGGVAPFFIGLIYLFVRFNDVVFIYGALFSSFIITRIIKYIVLAPRPVVYFAKYYPNIKLNQLSMGGTLDGWLSFPSGHTTAAFAMMFSLALLAKSRIWMFCCFVIAVLIGYSRIYLSQHFVTDVLAGSLVGTITTAIFYWIWKDQSFKWSDKKLNFPSLH